MDIIEGLKYDIKHSEKALEHLNKTIELLTDVDGITQEEYNMLCNFADKLDDFIIDKNVELKWRKEQ